MFVYCLNNRIKNLEKITQGLNELNSGEMIRLQPPYWHDTVLEDSQGNTLFPIRNNSDMIIIKNEKNYYIYFSNQDYPQKIAITDPESYWRASEDPPSIYIPFFKTSSQILKIYVGKKIHL